MRDIDWEILNQLYKNPNMTRVANLLYITQPSLTKRLKHMEEEFQVTIVNRTPKGINFTPEGEYLAKQAERFLELMAETRKGLEAFQGNLDKSITIGASYTYSKYTLTDILFSYKKTHPDAAFTVVNDQSNLLFRRMLEGTIDVGFIRGDYEGAVNRVLIGRSEAYLVTRDPVELEELPAMQRLEYKTNDRTLELLYRWWEDRFNSPMPAGMEVGYVDFAWQLIHRGFGYTCCFLPENFENTYNLCLTPLRNRDGTGVFRNTWFLYPKDKRRPEMLEDFICYVERELVNKRGKEKMI